MFAKRKHSVEITSILNTLEGSDDFAWACVCVEFPFHLGHPYSLCFWLRRQWKLGHKGIEISDLFPFVMCVLFCCYYVITLHIRMFELYVAISVNEA